MLRLLVFVIFILIGLQRERYIFVLGRVGGNVFATTLGSSALTLCRLRHYGGYYRGITFTLTRLGGFIVFGPFTIPRPSRGVSGLAICQRSFVQRGTEGYIF